VVTVAEAVAEEDPSLNGCVSSETVEGISGFFSAVLMHPYTHPTNIVKVARMKLFRSRVMTTPLRNVVAKPIQTIAHVLCTYLNLPGGFNPKFA
jgi:hypothetical protein